MKKSYFLVLIICLIAANTFAQDSLLLQQFIEKRNVLRIEKSGYELNVAEDSLSVWFVSQYPENEISLEMLNGLIIQNRLDREIYRSLFENFNKELFAENMTYKTIEWKLQRFDEKLAEGRKFKDFTVYNLFHKPVKISSILSKTKSTILVFCEANCMGCQYDLEYIEQNRNQIEQDCEIRFVYLEKDKESATSHFSASQSNDIFYVTNQFDSELAFLLSLNKTPTYFKINNQAIIVNADFNIRYIENKLPDYPFILEKTQQIKTIKLYHNVGEEKIINTNELLTFIKSIDSGKLQLLNVISSADTTGNTKYNKVLSEKRANYVYQKIKEQGVNAENIKIIGAGELKNTVLEEARTTTVEIYEILKEELYPGDKTNYFKIFFGGGQSTLYPPSIKYLFELLNLLQENPTLRIKVLGHVCCTQNGGEGTDIITGELNLSWARAKSVKAFLVGRGISEERIEIEGLAGKYPKYKGNIETEQFNRRAEIVVLDY